jgi:hypothetical protein
MSEQLRSKLSWFLKNLDFIIQDEAFEKEGIQINLYFDAIEVIQLVAGISYFYSPSGFKVDGLSKPEEGKPLRDKTLVLCLAYSGRLGSIRMLTPHQQEFLARLNRDFLLPPIHIPPNQLVRQFLVAINQSDPIKDEALSVGEMDERETLDFVRRHAKSAMDFFKILQLIRGVTWQSRLVSLRDRGVLELESEKATYQDIIHSDEFHKLRKALVRLRPNFPPLSNFADAVALSMLISMVADFRVGLSKAVPRFFISAQRHGGKPLLLQAVEDAGLKDSLRYESIFKRRHSVLRDSDFFVFKSTFQPPEDSADGQSESGFGSREGLIKLRGEICDILQPSKVLTTDLANRIAISGRPLIQVIDDLNTFLFFKNVWMHSSVQEQEIALEDLKRAAEQLTTESLRQRVNEGIRQARASLEENIKEYQLVSIYWGQIEDAVKALRKHFGGSVTARADYFRDFGLLRFAFPESSHDRINTVLDTLIYGTHDDEQTTHYNIIADCYLAHLAPDERYIDNLAAASSVLWVAKMYLQIVTLLASIRPSPHFSLDIVYAAAILETAEVEEHGIEIMKRLEERILVTNDLREEADLTVALAYLYYHLWKRQGYAPAWDPPAQGSAKVDDDGTYLISRAISSASAAFDMLGEWNMKKKVYALNQYLFYLVMGAEDSQVQEVDKAAEALLRYREDDRGQCWQHRFDDTLSRYYHRLARSSNFEADWESNLKDALKHSEAALSQAPWDEQTKDYNDRLKIQRRMGYGGLSPANPR